MRALMIKTSSMGDIIHTLPAITDACHALPSLTFDWVVEENFVEIPSWHARVNRVIPIALRRWRKNILAKTTQLEWKNFLEELRREQYDFIIDAQGLLKSAIITRFARGKSYGFNQYSARERLAALFYQASFDIPKKQHAIERLRSLLSQIFSYSSPVTPPSYGIDRTLFQAHPSNENYLVFLHATTWETKLWPEQYWIQLAHLADENGLSVKLGWGNEIEKARAMRIAAECQHADVLPRLDLTQMANVLANAKAVVTVDTGLGHLAAALNVPTVSLYGPTNPVLTGTLGRLQTHLTASFPCAPCLQRECALLKNQPPFNPPSPLKPPCLTTLLPKDVWYSLETLF